MRKIYEKKRYCEGKKLKAGYLGPTATFTDLAVQSAFPHVEKQPYVTIPDCIEAAQRKAVDMAVIPLENALEGSVNVTIDYLFHETSLPIAAEVIVPIQQHLMVHPHNEENWRQVEKILSHPHALAQCHQFLHKELHGIPLEQRNSTAAAAKYVQEHPEMNIAAIANELAAEKYQLKTVQENIHDYSFNHTRFIVLTHEPERISIPAKPHVEKTTIMVTLPSDKSGSLHQVLAAFAWRNLNLSKIESRPLKKGLGKYFL